MLPHAKDLNVTSGKILLDGTVIKELSEVLGISHASVHGQVNQLVR